MRVRLTGPGWRDLYPDIDLQDVVVDAEEHPTIPGHWLAEDFSGKFIGWISSNAEESSFSGVLVDDSLKKETTPEATSNDAVNHPAHYNSDPSGVECITIVRHRNFNIGGAFKYLWRSGLKDSETEIEDLEKAIFLIRDEINRLKGEYTQ